MIEHILLSLTADQLVEYLLARCCETEVAIYIIVMQIAANSENSLGTVM